MNQSEESSISSSKVPSMVLKSVNPFDYIKGRSRLERPVDIISSFKEKLRLIETIRLQEIQRIWKIILWIFSPR